MTAHGSTASPPPPPPPLTPPPPRGLLQVGQLPWSLSQGLGEQGGVGWSGGNRGGEERGNPLEGKSLLYAGPMVEVAAPQPPHLITLHILLHADTAPHPLTLHRGRKVR